MVAALEKLKIQQMIWKQLQILLLWIPLTMSGYLQQTCCQPLIV